MENVQTSLPDLSFRHGNVDLRPHYPHSAYNPTLRTYPRTDLKTLTCWTSFPNDIHQAIESATSLAHSSSTPFDINTWKDKRYVTSKKELHCYAMFALQEPVEQVLEKLGVSGRFLFTTDWHAAIVGSPDFSWVMDNGRHSKLIVEYQTWWSAHLEHVIAAFSSPTHGNTISQVQHALYGLERIYGYMCFNNNKFGIFTNWRHTLFLRRAETPDRKTLEYYIIELDGPDQSISMLKAWVGMVLLAKDDWYYAPPTTGPGQEIRSSLTNWKERESATDAAQEYQILPVRGGYHCLPLDFHLCRFDLNSACHGNISCMVNARLLASPFQQHDLQVICKVVDPSRYPEGEDLLDDEARAYAALEDLQGKVIPTVYGFYEIWGVLHLLALEPVGNAIPKDELIDPGLRDKMRAALRCIHEAGFVHGDIARRNFCRRESGEIFLVNLERCRRFEDPTELNDEINEVDGL